VCQLVSRPQQFDVMVMPNLYGNVVSNVCAGLVGGPGLVPGANYGENYAVFETVRGFPSKRERGRSLAWLRGQRINLETQHKHITL